VGEKDEKSKAILDYVKGTVSETITFDDFGWAEKRPAICKRNNRRFIQVRKEER
jgi:hypothetical protein